ncbi:MAG: hypothetical protein IJE05_02185, partial [Clostridia bacterium]|nr:hypothetical protein [Clostridia bacterium]
NEGTFNFYDGTITATKAIDGEATEVPLRYNISIGEQDSKQVATLQVMAGAEAAIGQKTFFKLEDAIAYANESIATDGSQVEVTIIDNLQKTETVEVADSKNIKLNLNGYEVSFLNVDDGITNNGKLEIVDTIGTGKIISTVRRTIRNEEGAELIMTSGTIVATGSNSFGICNYSTGIVTVTGGTITATKNGIYIGSTGTEIVKVTGGTITSNADSGIVNSGLGELRVEGGTVKTAGTAAILNNSTGIITVTGGTVTSTASNCYGINNNSNGTVTVAGGTVTGARYGIYNNVAGTIIIDDGKVSTTDTSSYGIYNNSTGTITINNGEIVASTSYSRGIYMKSGAVIMTGGTITSSSYGIDNYNGIVTMTGGIISSNSDGIYNSSTGTISIGEKDGTVNDASPSITSTQYGVYNNSSGKFNFYDGIIEGAVGQSLYGAVNEIEEGYNIIQTVEDSKEISTLGISECFKVVETDTVYSNLQDAIDSIDTDEVQTIQVLSDTIITADRGATNDKNIVLDLNGKAIKLGKSGTIDNNGTLEIIDSSENKTGVMTALAGRGVVNEESATLKVTGGTITNALRETSAIDNMGTMQVDGGTINATEYYSNVILNRGAGTLVVTGGTVTTSNYGNTIVNQDTATLTVTGGNVKSLYDGNSAIYNSSTGEVTVEGGTIISYENGIYNASTGAVIVNGGWIETSGYGIYNKSTGTVTVNDGTVIVTYRYSYAISNSTGTVIIKGGNITGNGEGSVAITNSGGTLIVEGGTITSGSWNAMYISGGTATITGATIKGNNYGMCISYTPTVTIGEKDGNVSTTVPSITGGQYGLYNESTGKVNFYDGVFTGATGKSTYGSMNEIEEEYDVVKTVDETTSTETAILQKVPAIINTTTNTEYYSLQTAITEAGENETLQVLRNMMTYSTQATIVVEEEKDVVLDLNGYSITFGQVNAIKNLGILTIEDSSESKAGSILSTVGNVITNEDGATLNITGGTITNTLSNTNAIYNTGILQLDGGTVKVTNIFAYGIYNASAGIVTVAGGTVLSTGDYSYGIYNNSTGTVTVDGGTVRVTAWESYGIYNNSSGEVIVSNGEVTMTNSYTSGIYNKSSGTVKMTGGKVTVGGSSDAIENESAGTVIISNGEVIGTGNYGDAISDYGGTLIITGGNITATGSGGHAIGSSGTLTLEGGTITGSYSNAIEFSGKTSTITGGTIKGNTYGIYISSTGTVTIGEKDGNVSTTDPSITGGQYGLYNSSTAKVNFYDGIIQGPTGKSTYGSMNEIENEYDLVKTVDETTSTETAILQKIPAIINTTTNTEYYSLQTAIAEAGEQEKLQVLRNMMTYSAQETIEVEAEKDVVLDLNGYSITFGKANAIKNLGTFAIEDGSEGKTGSMLSTVGNIITNEEGATLKTTGGTITNTVGYTSSIDNMGILQVEGGTIQATGSSSKTIINRGTGTVIVTGGSVTTSSADDSIGIYNNSTGTVTVEGGTVIGDKYGIYNALTGTVIVNEGRVSATDTWWPYSICAIYNNTTGGITITGGTLTSNGIGIQNYSTGTIMMSGGTITTTEEGIINSAGGLTITGGSITANGEEAIYNSRGIVTIEDATITSSSVDGIYNDTGRITIIGGTVTGNNGIYNNSTGEITIGEKDGNVSATVPSITGTQYGVYNSSTGIVNFYDGILKGSTQAISGNVTDIETNYEIKYAESATIATLELTATNYKSISIGDIYYETLQAAVNDAQDGATIELWADVTLESTVEIPEGLNITIELNGNNLTGNGLDVLINNRGTVNVVDSVGTGSISNPDGETIKDVT